MGMILSDGWRRGSAFPVFFIFFLLDPSWEEDLHPAGCLHVATSQMTMGQSRG